MVSVCLTCLPVTTSALSLSDYNVNLSGYTQYQGRYRTIGDATIIDNTGTIRINADTFLWYPWLALLDGGIGFSVSSVQDDINNQTAQTVDGRINLRLFPQSHFPFNAFYNRTNSVVDGDIDVASPDRVLTRFGVNQSYKTDGNSHINAGYSRTLSTADQQVNLAGVSLLEESDGQSDNLNLAISTSYDEHSFNLNSEYETVDRNIPDESQTRIMQALRHEYRPVGTFSVNNLLSYNASSFETLGASNDFSLLQLNSNAFWRPETEKPLLISGSALLQSLTSEFDAGSLESKTAIFSGNGSYQWSPFINLHAGGSLTTIESDTDSRVLTSQRVGANYSPAVRPRFGFNYTYNLSADLVNHTGAEEGASQQALFNVGHLVNRSWPMASGMLTFSASQNANTEFNTIGGLNRALRHSLTSGWSKIAADSTTSVHLSMNDQRRFGSNEFGLQFINLQVSRNQRLTKNSSLNGNVSFNATRPLGSAGGSVTGDESSWDYNTSADLNYTHMDLFGVPRLSFVSELRYMTNSLFEVVQSDRIDLVELDEKRWQNRLEYQIGRLELRLIGNVGQFNEINNSFILFQVRRNFGR